MTLEMRMSHKTLQNVYCCVRSRYCHYTQRCVAECCGVLQCVAVCCSVLQCVAVCCSDPIRLRMSTAAYGHAILTTHSSVLQCVEVCCSVF